jgi:hypothetical protein
VDAVDAADVVDGADVAVVHGGSGPGLALEALHRLGRIEQGYLQGDAAAQQGIFGLVDSPHAALAHLGQDGVAPEPAGQFGMLGHRTALRRPG